MFIIDLTYTAPLEQIDALLQDHVQFLKSRYADGTFLASGRKNPRTGGVILAKAASRSALEEILAQDPFQRERVAAYDITEFIPTMTAPELEAILEEL